LASLKKHRRGCRSRGASLGTYSGSSNAAACFMSDPVETPGAYDHLVVIGPLSELVHARLLRSGLALAGSAASTREDPLGVGPVAPPRKTLGIFVKCPMELPARYP